ncbi:MAG: M20 metallopeptidase family protein [Candidatus Saccharicenans sp.]|uniref:M20 metallopeptidase family protein n=1 Tax=Candidatus Saccharicenans sp. TaxID=2819258 RepID=UPI00404944E4
MVKFIFCWLLIFVCLEPGLAASQAILDTKLAQAIDLEIEKNRAEMIKIRRFLHMNPELGNHELETAKLIASKLRSMGLEVKTGMAKTGVVGLLRGTLPGPTVAIRADMDALPIQELNTFPYRSLNPGVMHACGHDLHMTIALGTAMVLSTVKDKIRGNVKFIFQPAEEGLPPGEEGGAALMIKEGVLENPPVRAIFALHVWPELETGTAGYASGYLMASSDNFILTIEGKGAHAARPQEGIDAIVLAAEVITNLQTIISRALDPVEPAVLTVGKIQGGTKANIIAEKVEMEGTVRTLNETVREKIPILMENVIGGITKSYGASYKFRYEKGTPPLYNHPDLVQAMLPALEGALRPDKVVAVKPQMVAEDFALLAEKVPAFMYLLGVKSPGQTTAASLHSPYFNPDERAIPVGIKAMCHLVLSALEQQAALKNSTVSDPIK